MIRGKANFAVSTAGNCSRVRCARSLGLAFLLLCLAGTAVAQQYQADDVDKNAFKNTVVAQNCIKEPTRYAADKDKFTEYFVKFYFPAMTQFGPDDLSKLGDARYNLFSKFLWPSKSEELQRDLTQLAFDAANGIVFSRDKNYHPAVKYNAVLILGLLDDQYADAGGTKHPPKPHVKANEKLVAIVKAAGDGKHVPPSLLVGALVGLERHAQFHDAFKQTQIDAMTSAVLKLASLNPPAPDLDPQVAEWIRLQTATILAELGTVGPNNQSHIALMKFLADPSMTLDTRGRVAALFASIKYDGASIDGKATADGMLNFAKEVADAEAKRAQEFQEKQVATGGGGGGYSPMASRGRGESMRAEVGQSNPNDYDRRTLLARIGDLRRGINALKPVVPADKQPVFDAVLAAIKPVMDAAENKDTVSLALVDKVQKMAGEIQRVAKPSAPLAAKGQPGSESEMPR
jgi:hypothetical protein